MSGTAAWRCLRVAPMSCAVLGCVLVLGTVVGQVGAPGPDAESVSSPVAGMNMPGMHVSAGPPAGGEAAAPMAGRDMSSTAPASDMKGMDTPGAASPGKPATMDMSAPGMAAQMPGGLHSSCTAPRTCMVVFDKHATGVASVLGLKTTLTRLTTTTAQLRVNGHGVTLKGKRAVRTHGVTLQIIRIGGTEVAIRMVKAR